MHRGWRTLGGRSVARRRFFSLRVDSPRKGQASKPQRLSCVTRLRYGVREDNWSEGRLRCRWTNSFEAYRNRNSVRFRNAQARGSEVVSETPEPVPGLMTLVLIVPWSVLVPDITGQTGSNTPTLRFFRAAVSLSAISKFVAVSLRTGLFVRRTDVSFCGRNFLVCSRAMQRGAGRAFR